MKSLKILGKPNGLFMSFNLHVNPWGSIRRVPVSASSSQLIYDSLRASGVRIISALPETWLVHLVRLADDDPEMTLVRLAKEEEGVGISMGAHLAGVRSAMLMQNHGFLAP